MPNTNETNAKIAAMFDGITGGMTEGRMAKLARIVAGHDNVHLEECSDERTGHRYGLSAIRAGKCEKIGGGGRNRGQKYAYQVWAVWA